MNYTYAISENNITLIDVLNGRVLIVRSDNEHYKTILDLINDEDYEAAFKLASSKKEKIQTFNNNITIRGNQVLYKGNVLHNAITDRIVRFVDQGLPYQSMVNFLNNLMRNHRKSVVERLDAFLLYNHLPITPDGCFLAYKSINGENNTDWHTGTVTNMVGVPIPRMEENEVDDNHDKACSTGYHVGTLEYATDFHSYDKNQKIIICKVNPADVGSVPYDAKNQKVRCSFYEIVSVFTEELDNDFETV